MALRKGEHGTAPGIHGTHRLGVVAVGDASNGLQLVRWEEGPLKGREARLAAGGLRSGPADPEDFLR